MWRPPCLRCGTGRRLPPPPPLLYPALQPSSPSLQCQGGGSTHQQKFEAKEMTLAVSHVDVRGKPAGPSLASLTLNLANYAATGRVQQSLVLVPSGGGGGRNPATSSAGPPRLLVTIACREAGGKAAPPLVAGSAAAAPQGGATADELDEWPARMSTDEEGKWDAFL